jgi:hypothetical protein
LAGEAAAVLATASTGSKKTEARSRRPTPSPIDRDGGRL